MNFSPFLQPGGVKGLTAHAYHLMNAGGTFVVPGAVVGNHWSRRNSQAHDEQVFDYYYD